MSWNDGPRAIGDRSFDLDWIQIKRQRIDINEDRIKTGPACDLGNGPEGERGENYFTAGRELQRLTNVVESHAAERRRDGFIHVMIGREALFKLADRGTVDGFTETNGRGYYLLVA